MQNKTWAIILFAIGVFMAALDNGIISAAFTTINYEFGVNADWGAWSITVYTLGLAISIPIVGKLSDRYGRKRLFLIEIFLFGLGSLLVALSPTFEILLASRLVQSLGGGGIFIIASSHILSTFPKEKQGSALGALGGMNGIAAVLGPNIGSFILGLTGSWHWLFFINIPIAIMVLILGYRFIPESREENTRSLDLAGIVVLSLAIISFMYGLTNLNGTNLSEMILDPKVYVFVCIGIILFFILFKLEQRVLHNQGDPILPINLIKKSNYLLTLLLGTFSGAILASVIFIPAYVEQVLGVSTDLSGYYFTPLAIASGIGAGGGGRLVDRKGPIFTLTLASLLAIIGALLFPLWVTNTWHMIIASCLLGIGFGSMLGAPLNVLATENSSSNKGIALGTLSLFRQIGMTIAPTIYAGFIARAFLDIGERIEQNLKEAGVDGSSSPVGELDQLQDLDYQEMIAQVEQIPVPPVRDAILEAIHGATSTGYNQLYLTASIVAGLTLITTIVLYGVRKGKKPRAQGSET